MRWVAEPRSLPRASRPKLSRSRCSAPVFSFRRGVEKRVRSRGCQRGRCTAAGSLGSDMRTEELDNLHTTPVEPTAPVRRPDSGTIGASADSGGACQFATMRSPRRDANASLLRGPHAIGGRSPARAMPSSSDFPRPDLLECSCHIARTSRACSHAGRECLKIWHRCH